MPYPYEHWEHDSWEGRGWGPPSPPPQARYYKNTYRHSGHLTPEPQYSNLHRSHSQGHNTAHPTNIHIHNKIPITQETTSAQRTDSRLPMPAPMPPPPQFQQMPMMQPPMFVHQQVPMMAPPPMVDHHALRAQRLGEQLLAEQMADMHLHRHRSHSRGRSTEDQSARLRWELEQQRRDAAAAEARRRHDEDTAALKQQIELERRKEEASAAEAKRIREEEANALKLKLEVEAEREAIKRKQAEEDAAADRQRVIDDYERKRLVRSRSVRRELMKISSIANVKREAEEERAYREALRKQKEKEEAKEREYQAFLREQKEKQEAEDQAKKEEQARIDSVMRARLEKLGYSQHEIELALDPEKAEKEKKKKKKHRYSGDGDIIMVPPSLPDATPMMSVGFAQGNGHVPVYPRINRKFLDIETLEHYHVPWEWDRANSEYIILLRELDKYETDVLFEHTRRRRQGLSAPLLIEKSKDKAPNFAWVRRKSKDRSKSRGRDIRVTEIVRR
ncbi:unnamed protein product [Aureobasidium pullulans]|nr:unnamed protein product [Aureobasidium pullulans]